MTILEALRYQVKGYPIDKGLFEFILLKRGLDSDAECSTEIINSKPFIGARADIVAGLIDTASLGQGGISISITDKSLLVKMANKLYKEIGEPPIREYADDDKPTPTVTMLDI